MGFYGDRRNINAIANGNGDDYTDDHSEYGVSGGRKARETLKQIEEMDEN